MASLSNIKQQIAEETAYFETHFKGVMKSKVPLLDIVTNYILRRKGKQLRPMLVFLSAKLTGEIRPSTYHAASLVELLHTATLIHDDVVDESYERRGYFSISALWRSKIAVLMGDYLLAKGLLLSIDNNEFELLRIVSGAVKEMSEGELLQIQKSRGLNLTIEQYFEIIEKKTATLIAACTACGAHSAGASEEITAKMHQFGLYTGIAFQIKDDLFDYLPKGIIGKPTGNDLKEKKLTLPLLYALEHSSYLEKRQVIRTIRYHHRDEKKIASIIEFVKNKQGIEYARDKMMEYKNKAEEILLEFEPSSIRQALLELLDYIVLREK